VAWVFAGKLTDLAGGGIYVNDYNRELKPGGGDTQ